jgi:hypothetical protein
MWARQQRLAALSPRGRHVTTSKTSFIPQISDPVLVVETIRSIVIAGSTLKRIRQTRGTADSA